MIASILLSCSLDRTNPLDPVNNINIKVPGQITGIELLVSPTTAQPRYIDIRWNRLDNINGYYIYRAFSLHSSFERIATITVNETVSYRDIDNIIPGRTYWYVLSAFNVYPEGTIEGKRSTPQGRIVN